MLWIGPGENPFIHHSAASPRSYPNQLVNAAEVIGGLNARVDAFSRWSFTNRGDLDGQWQLVRTFDPTTWQYFKRVTPEPVPYSAYGILTRFMANHSAVLQTENSNTDLVVAAVRSPKENLMVYILNKSAAKTKVSLVLTRLPSPRILYKYQVTNGAANDPHFKMNPLGHFEVAAAGQAAKDELPAMSLTAYSTFKLMHADAGIILD